MKGAVQKALTGLRNDALRSTRRNEDRELLIRIGLEEAGEATFPNELVEPERTGGEKLPGSDGYPEERRRRSR